MSNDPDSSDLEARVDELEDTLQKMMPSRRSVLAGAAGLGLGAAGMSGATGSAAAQSAAGQIGTASEPVDVEGAQGNFQALEAANEAVEVKVPSDFDTINAALQKTNRLLPPSTNNRITIF